MLNIVKLYLKSFLAFSLFFGIGVALLFYFLDPFTETFSEALMWGMGAGVFFGIFMSWKLVPEQIGEHGEVYELKHEIQTSLDLDLTNSYLKAKKVLEDLGFKITKTAENYSYLEASTGWRGFRGMFAWSWGENVTIKLMHPAKERTLVSVASRPKNPLQIIDAGTNLSNVEKIIEHLKKKAHD